MVTSFFVMSLAKTALQKFAPPGLKVTATQALTSVHAVVVASEGIKTHYFSSNKGTMWSGYSSKTTEFYLAFSAAYV